MLIRLNKVNEDILTANEKQHMINELINYDSKNKKKTEDNVFIFFASR